MSTNEEKSLNYKFHSITNLYKGTKDTDLSLEIYEYGSDAVEIKLINTNYKQQQATLKKHFIFLILCFYIYSMIFLFKSFHLLFIDAVFILWLIPLLWRLTQLTEFGKLLAITLVILFNKILFFFRKVYILL